MSKLSKIYNDNKCLTRAFGDFYCAIIISRKSIFLCSTLLLRALTRNEMNLYASSVNTAQRIKNAITIAKLTFPINERLERFPGIVSSVAIVLSIVLVGSWELRTQYLPTWCLGGVCGVGGFANTAKRAPTFPLQPEEPLSA